MGRTSLTVEEWLSILNGDILSNADLERIWRYYDYGKPFKTEDLVAKYGEQGNFYNVDNGSIKPKIKKSFRIMMAVHLFGMAQKEK